MPLVLASHNAGKRRELTARLAPLGIALLPPPEALPPVDETEDSLEGNARLKAEALCIATGMPALADDTGLFVSALGGRPGVQSARFAGPNATDADNRAHLLYALEAVPNPERTAYFETVLCLALPDGTFRTFSGRCAGTLLREERGMGGFGYDALFVPDGHAVTFAEIDPAVKNRISHRALALDAFIALASAHPDLF